MTSWKTDNDTSWRGEKVLALWDDLVALWDSVLHTWDAVSKKGAWYTKNETDWKS